MTSKPACGQIEQSTPGGLRKRRSLAGERPSVRAFTLAEMVVSLCIMTILMGALASAMYMTTQAMPAADNPLRAEMDAAVALDRIATDVHTAIAVSNTSTHEIKLFAHDRDSDGNDEAIYYQWGGTAGDPLTCTLNDAAPLTLLPDVREFALSYDLLSLTEQRVQDTAIQTTLASNNGYDYAYEVSSSHWIGQAFAPVLPDKAKSWAVTRIKFLAASSYTADDLALVQIRPADQDLKPDGTALWQAEMEESELDPSFTWREFPVSGVSGLTAGDGLCLLVVFGGGVGNACEVAYEHGSFGSSPLVYTTSGGSSWTVNASYALSFYVYGTYVSPEEQEVEVQYLNRVDIRIRAGDYESSGLETAVQVLNQPEVSGP